jgi:hypothetical protein
MVSKNGEKFKCTIENVLLMVGLLFERGGIVTNVANVTDVAAVVL